MKPSEICDKAADLITERGWAQQVYQSTDGSLCIVGACRVVSGVALGAGIVTHHPAYLFALAGVRKAVGAYANGKEITNLALWNDNVPIDKDEVITVLRKGAQWLRANGEIIRSDQR